jgi:hypothetical protein
LAEGKEQNVAYETMATTTNPALVVYVLDVSASMNQKLGAKRRIDVVVEALRAALTTMVHRSTKGLSIRPRYRLAMFAYSDHVYDLLDGIKTIVEVAAMGTPELSAMRTTDTARAFAQVEQLLLNELPRLGACPAPLVCHITDGEYTGDDPEPIIQRIMELAVPDGNVLVENIFISDRILPDPIVDVRQWPGVLPSTNLTNEYAQKLRAMSSTLPESYRQMMEESSYRIKPGALMLLPGLNPEMVAMGFQMSASTTMRLATS